MGWWCCSLRASSVLVCCLYLLLHTAALVTNFVIMNAPEQHVDNIIAFIDTNDQKLQESVLYTRVKPYLMEKAGEYLALPITVNLVLMVANLLASWGALTTLPLLLVPWLILYGVYALFAASLLAYMIVLLQDIWFRVLLFLVVAPLLVLHSGCWLLLLRLYRAMRVGRKAAAPPPPPVLPPMFTPEPPPWVPPLPIWAVAPPQTTWDPSYLQQLDPRFRESRSRSRRSSRSRSRRSSSHSRSQSQPSSSYRPSDSVSLSDKYGRYETEDPSEYRTEEETEVGETEGEVTEMEEETEMEESGLDEEEDTEVEEEFETRDSFHTEEEVRYSPRARPKSRAELYSMPGTTTHSSNA